MPRKKTVARKPPQRETGSEFTVNGKPIPTHFAHAIPFAYTDQGLAEKAAKADPTSHHVRVTADAFDKAIEARADAVEPWEMPDPMKELTDAYVEQGMRPKFLSPRVCETRGMRGFEVVKKPNGDPVKLANMVLGVMPEEKARQRNEHYRRQGEDQLREATEKTTEEQERLISAANAAGVSLLPAGEMIRDHESRRVATTGLRSVRGNEAELLER